MNDCYWLSDEQFARLEPLQRRDTRGLPRVDDRRVISGIAHVVKSGARQIDTPACYGPRETLYNRFVHWADQGIWTRLFAVLTKADRPHWTL